MVCHQVNLGIYKEMMYCLHINPKYIRGGVCLNNYRKDRKPEHTIFEIRKILNSLGIFVVEKRWQNFAGEWFSVRLELEGFPQLGVNGKGKTERLALASGFGELMERLQTRYLLKSNYGMKENPKMIFADEKIVSTEVIVQMDDIISSLFAEHLHGGVEELLESNSKYRVCAPFYNVTDQVEVDLPVRLIEAVTGSNGLCAGNTAQEGLVQGICEILERYVHKEIYRRKLILPTISDEKLMDYDTFLMIQKLRSYGYRVLVKDCTMGGKYPVVGLLLMNPSRFRYLFTLGSDPDFNIALQRCVTEMFQGVKHDENFLKKMTVVDWEDVVGNQKWAPENMEEPIYIEWIKTLSSNIGHYPLSIFVKTEEHSNFSPFLKPGFSNQEAFELLIESLTKDQRKVYIRDYSYLGFPTFRVYIPEMTECLEFCEKELLYRKKEYWLRQILLNLKEASNNELQEFVTTVEEIKKVSHYKLDNIFNLLSGLILKGESFYLGVKDTFFIANCWYKIGDFKKSYKYLAAYVKNEGNSLANTNYFISFLIYFQLKNQGKSLKEIAALLRGMLGDDICKGWIQDFENYEVAFTKMETASCPDCNRCEIDTECCYPSWEKLHRCLQAKERTYVRDYSFIK